MFDLNVTGLQILFITLLVICLVVIYQNMRLKSLLWESETKYDILNTHCNFKKQVYESSLKAHGKTATRLGDAMMNKSRQIATLKDELESLRFINSLHQNEIDENIKTYGKIKTAYKKQVETLNTKLVECIKDKNRLTESLKVLGINSRTQIDILLRELRDLGARE